MNVTMKPSLKSSPPASQKQSWQHALFIELVLLVALLMGLATWLVLENKRALPALEASAQSDQKLQCVSYAPYYGPHQSPVVPGIHVSRSQIEQDLKKLSSMTDCVRTYAVAQGLDAVPEVAKSLGLKVMLGAWVGWTDEDNRKEVALAVKRANAYPETVKGIIVGNEVLLRREQPEEMVRDYLRWAQAHTEVPVTYADVWEFWLKHPKLEQEVDFITVHILPYWEDAPVAIEYGAKHTQAVMQKLASKFQKPLFIGETGWPSVGRQRFGAEPSLINEARYLREFLQTARAQGWQYNVIEAIDQPWKRDLEGTVGGYWGVFDTDLNPKFSLQGAVPARQDGHWPWGLAVLLAVGLLTWTRFKQQSSLTHQLKATVVGGLLGITAYLQAEYLWQACRDMQEWLALGGVTLLGDGLVLMGVLSPLNGQKGKLRVLTTLLLFTMLYASFWLWLDGRYRNFPLVLYSLPVLALLISQLAHLLCKQSGRVGLDGLAKVALTMGGLATAFSLRVWHLEPQNQDAMCWLLLVLSMSIVVWLQSASIQSEQVVNGKNEF